MAGPESPGKDGNNTRDGEAGEKESTQRHSWNFLGILFFLPVSLGMLVWWLFQKRKG